MPPKLYLQEGDTLSAVRPKFFAMVRYRDSYRYVFGFDKAGVGPCAKRFNSFQSLALFLSPEDFERFKASGNGLYHPEYSEPSAILRANGYTIENGRVTVWHVENGRPKSSSDWDSRFLIWSDRDGMHADHEKVNRYGQQQYRSREECAAAIPKARVVDFDDEPASQPQEQEFIVNLPKQVAVSAKTAEEAEAKVAESIRNLVNQ